MTRETFNEMTVAEQIEDAWEYIAHAFGVDANKEESVEEFRHSDEFSDGYKERFEGFYEEYQKLLVQEYTDMKTEVKPEDVKGIFKKNFDKYKEYWDMYEDDLSYEDILEGFESWVEDCYETHGKYPSEEELVEQFSAPLL